MLYIGEEVVQRPGPVPWILARGSRRRPNRLRQQPRTAHGRRPLLTRGACSMHLNST